MSRPICECNGGTPCACPDCDHPDCIYKKGCSCTVTGPGFDETTWDSACPFHGDNGTMVATVPVRSLAVGRPAQSLPRVRMFMSLEAANALSEPIRVGPPMVRDRLRDQMWLHVVLQEQRKRTNVAEREAFDERADRILERLDP